MIHSLTKNMMRDSNEFTDFSAVDSHDLIISEFISDIPDDSVTGRICWNMQELLKESLAQHSVGSWFV